MSWHELELTVPREQLEGVSLQLFELGCAGISEEVPADELRSSWEPSCPPSQFAVLRASFAAPERSAIDSLLATLGFSGAWRELPNVDWGEAWKDAHQPLQLSPRICVAPPWNVPEGAISIEPGQGFGTGQHPTTALAAQALDPLFGGVQTLLDVGCGSGVLALAGARLGLEVRGVDVQYEAIEEARANAARNGLTATFSTTPLAEVQRGAELVVANVHAEVLLRLAADLERLSERWLVLCGILVDREARVRESLVELEFVARAQEAEWVCLTYCRR